MYHKNAMTINKYVEAEGRTALKARYGGPLSFRFATNHRRKARRKAGTSRLSAMLNGVAMAGLGRGENRGFTRRKMEPSDEC
jgi:hypothetical protein